MRAIGHDDGGHRRLLQRLLHRRLPHRRRRRPGQARLRRRPGVKRCLGTRRTDRATKRQLRSVPRAACVAGERVERRRRRGGRARAGDRLGVPPLRPRRDGRRRADAGPTSRPTSSSSGPRRRSSPASPTSAPAAACRASGRPPRSPGWRRRRASPARWPPARHPRPGVRPLREPTSTPMRIEWCDRSAARSSSSSTASPPARASSFPTTRGRDRSPRSRAAATGPIVLEERLTRPGVHPDRAVRRHDGAVAAAARPGPQAHRRGRHRPEHRRHGRLRPGARRLLDRRARRDVRPAGARPLRRRRHARTSACSTPG